MKSDKAETLGFVWIFILTIIVAMIANILEQGKVEKANRNYYAQHISTVHICRECGGTETRICHYGNSYRDECQTCHEKIHGKVTWSRKLHNYVWAFIGVILASVLISVVSNSDYYQCIHLLAGGIMARRFSKQPLDFQQLAKSLSFRDKVTIVNQKIISWMPNSKPEYGLRITLYSHMFEIVVTNSEICLFGNKDSFASTCVLEMKNQGFISDYSYTSDSLKLAKHWILSGTTKFTPQKCLTEMNAEQDCFRTYRAYIMEIAQKGGFELDNNYSFPFIIRSDI